MRIRYLYGYPVIAVLGYKNSGKTTLISLLVNSLRARGFKVGVIKHIADKYFTIDTPGTDTWKFKRCGSNVVGYVANSGEAGLYGDFGDLDMLLRFFLELGCGVVFLEGFSRWVRDRNDVAKIVCVRDFSEVSELTKGVVNVIAVCSPYISGNGVAKLPEQFDEVLTRVLKYIELQHKVREVLTQLPGLNCGKCGLQCCGEFALAVVRGLRKLEECKARGGSLAKVIVRDREIALNKFVSKLLHDIVLAILRNLKDVEVTGSECVEVTVR